MQLIEVTKPSSSNNLRRYSFVLNLLKNEMVSKCQGCCFPRIKCHYFYAKYNVILMLIYLWLVIVWLVRHSYLQISSKVSNSPLKCISFVLKPLKIATIWQRLLMTSSTFFYALGANGWYEKQSHPATDKHNILSPHEILVVTLCLMLHLRIFSIR